MKEAKDYKKYWDQYFEAKEKREDIRFKNAQASARVVAQALATKFKAKKIYLFGSGIDRKSFHNDSDIDLAVEGIPPAKYFSALSQIEQLLEGKIKIDLIPLEDATPKLKETIEKKGIKLYG